MHKEAFVNDSSDENLLAREEEEGKSVSRGEELASGMKTK